MKVMSERELRRKLRQEAERVQKRGPIKRGWETISDEQAEATLEEEKEKWLKEK